MGLLLTKKFDTLNDLFVDQVKDLYDAEQRLTKAIPHMVEAAQSPELKSAFEHHLKETEGQVKRLEKVFELIDTKPDRETCDAMKGLLSEGDEVLDSDGDPSVIDAALIAAAQRVEHYEMAGYGTARTLARQLGLEQVAELLQQTLNEESAADDKLTHIAETSVNVAAATS
ncbi:ferritin-like domain-containing protein [Aeoliella sp. ICT_H6.2]|uniref:Ferritin-like domain-containing protein n=1 Tax=Aeoliella straminimaris TaxID=2954799 RepID=A0A9X2FHK0_9BACT|nr:ferritin-like domain-containing protein [Aeoliella straminimaris]MCO6045016.1 ferritin-like domain-containing protein [Aeoliella straminimaris]